MPLINSTSKKALRENIAIERKHGRPEKQAVAIAFSKKRALERHREGVGKSHITGKRYSHN